MVVITGGTGFIGQFLTQKLLEEGHKVCWLVRRPAKHRTKIRCQLWDPMRGILDKKVLTKATHIVNLAGASIVSAPWTHSRKALLWKSRIQSTKLLVDTINMLSNRPKVLVSASAIGFYTTSSEEMTEESTQGQGFLAELTSAWEKEAFLAEKLGLKVVCLRIGLVLGKSGSALTPLLRSVRMGIAPVLGSGQQYMSWIHQQDLAALFLNALFQDQWQGIYNATAPQPVQQRTFMRLLAATTEKKAFFPVIPSLLLKTLLGQRSQLILASQRILPAYALKSGFSFTFPTPSSALQDLLTLDT